MISFHLLQCFVEVVEKMYLLKKKSAHILTLIHTLTQHSISRVKHYSDPVITEACSVQMNSLPRYFIILLRVICLLSVGSEDVSVNKCIGMIPKEIRFWTN